MLIFDTYHHCHVHEQVVELPDRLLQLDDVTVSWSPESFLQRNICLQEFRPDLLREVEGFIEGVNDVDDVVNLFLSSLSLRDLQQPPMALEILGIFPILVRFRPTK